MRYVCYAIDGGKDGGARRATAHYAHACCRLFYACRCHDAAFVDARHARAYFFFFFDAARAPRRRLLALIVSADAA